MDEFILYLGHKVSDKNIDIIVNEFYQKFDNIKNGNTKLIIDFSDVEWIANQELLVITGVLKYLINSKIYFKVRFLKLGRGIETIDKRKARQLIQIWEVWKIYQIIPNENYDLYFDIDGRFINRLKDRHKISSKEQIIYNRYGVTPFISLTKVERYDDRRIREMLSTVYQLNAATNDILRSHNCELPFVNKTLSLIITKELYENFLDHFGRSFFMSAKNEAFMSLSLKAKFDERAHSKDNIQAYLKRNFDEEAIPESINFFYDTENKKFKNQSVVQLSFLDFGDGIAKTLKAEYMSSNEEVGGENLNNSSDLDARILEYAFLPSSSKHPIDERYSKSTAFPRGLFDLLSIVKRFNGLLVVRSNYGKICYDFSTGKAFNNAVRKFGHNEFFFPGTLISIYIPERSDKKNIDTSVIKPFVDIDHVSFLRKKIKYISLFQIQVQLNKTQNKQNIYNSLFRSLYKEFASPKEGTLIYLDFKGYDLDERITKKLIFFLISDYTINHFTSVIVINPPPREYLEEIKREIIALSEVIKHYYIHPTPFIYHSSSNNDLTIFWLGVFLEKDIKKLNELLYDIHDLRRGDFENSQDISGNVNYYDEFGNLRSLINPFQIKKVISRGIFEANEFEIHKIATKYIRNEPNKFYLCNGNYYQNEYFELVDMMSDKDEFEYLCKALIEKVSNNDENLSKYKIVSITPTSERIVKILH